MARKSVDERFAGRVSRKTYLKYFIYYHLIMTPLYIYFLLLILEGRVLPILDYWYVWVLMIGIFIAKAFVLEGLTVRRFHDLNRPGRHLWLIFPEVPLSWTYHFWDLLLKEGTDGPNDYGDPPFV